eukprot:gene26872-33519_t
MRVEGAALVLDDLHWGYQAIWAKGKMPVAVNARLEKITGKYWASLLGRGRCIVPADGWHEWTEEKGSKQPWHTARTAASNGFALVTADAQGGMELVKVVDPSSMRFEGRVSADKVGVVKTGQSVVFAINGYPGQNFNGKVKRVDPAANSVTRQVEVLVEFADKARPGVAGLFAEGRIEAASTAALMIPESALVKQGDDTYAWKIKDKALVKARLDIGVRDARSGAWQVEKGLASGDMVLQG